MPGSVRDKDLGWRKIKAAIRDADGWHVTVGVHTEDAEGAGPVDNATLAAFHEFGTATIPERSFLRSAFDQKAKRYAQFLADGAALMAAGRAVARQVVGQLGEIHVSDIVNLIRAGIDPPLKPATIARKGSTTPLIDTGQMVQAIKPKVSRKRDLESDS